METNLKDQFHPKLRKLLKFPNSADILCPFCFDQLKIFTNRATYSCNCGKRFLIHTNRGIYSHIFYKIILDIKNTNFVSAYISAYFNKDKTVIQYGDKSNIRIKIIHTDFAYFNELAMRSKLKTYLTFL